MCYRFMGILFQISEQINTILFERTSYTQTKRAEIHYSRGTIHRGNFKYGHSENAR